MKKISIILLVIVMSLGILGIKNSKAEYAMLMGVENGVCVVPETNLWDKPGGLLNGAVLTDSIQHNCQGLWVMVTKSAVFSGKTYYYIKTYGADAGKSGWVSELQITKPEK